MLRTATMQITCIDSQKMRPVEFIGLNFVIVNHTGLLALLQEFVAGISQRTAIYPLWWGSWRRTLCPPLQVPGIIDTGLINTFTNLKLSFDGEASFWSNLKGQCHEIFTPHFFHKLTTPGPLMNRLDQFREIFPFHRDIHKNSVSAYYCNTPTRLQ